MLSKVSFMGARVLSRRALVSGAANTNTNFLLRAACNQTAIRAFASNINQHAPAEIEKLNRVQHSLLEALISCSDEPLSSCRRDAIALELQDLPLDTCPTTLEFLSEDHTLLIPTKAFRKEEPCFASLLDKVLGETQLDEETWDAFWKTFAYFYHSPRVVRCSDTQAQTSTIEESNVLWPH